MINRVIPEILWSTGYEQVNANKFIVGRAFGMYTFTIIQHCSCVNVTRTLIFIMHKLHCIIIFCWRICIPFSTIINLFN